MRMAVAWVAAAGITALSTVSFAWSVSTDTKVNEQAKAIVRLEQKVDSLKASVEEHNRNDREDTREIFAKIEAIGKSIAKLEVGR